MLEELGQDYIRTARAKGLSEGVVVYRHALRNALIPVLTVVGLPVWQPAGGSDCDGDDLQPAGAGPTDGFSDLKTGTTRWCRDASWRLG